MNPEPVQSSESPPPPLLSLTPRLWAATHPEGGGAEAARAGSVTSKSRTLSRCIRSFSSKKPPSAGMLGMRPLRPASVGVTSASPGGAKPGRGPRSLNSGSPEAVCFLDIGDTCGEGREARGGSGSRGREAGGGAGGKPAGKRSRGRAGRGSPTEMFDFVRRVRGRGRGFARRRRGFGVSEGTRTSHARVSRARRRRWSANSRGLGR